MWQIPLFDLDYDQSEFIAVKEVLEGKWLTMGPKTKEFENKFSEYHGHNVKCCAVSSCTAALHMALMLCDVKPGDEVVISGLTFVAAINVVKLVGATPVLADSKSFEDWNVSVEDIAAKITGKTKALIIVHFAGYPCDMEDIQALVKKKNIALIEDVAHAIGAEYRGRKCGTYGDIACYSFFSNKNLSTGEGGMIVSTHEEFDRSARLLRSHGMTSLTIDRHENKAISYDVIKPGLNYRIDEIRSALGIVQLSKLDENNKKRGTLVKEYIECLSSLNNIIIPWSNMSSDKKPSYHIFPILLPSDCNRLALINYLKENGIQTSIHYPAFTGFSYYNEIIREDIKIANEISARSLTLPLYPGMNREHVRYICDKVISGLGLSCV